MLEEEYTPLNYFLLGKASPPPSAGGITPLYMLNMLFSQWQEETLAMLEEEYIPLKYIFLKTFSSHSHAMTYNIPRCPPTTLYAFKISDPSSTQGRLVSQGSTAGHGSMVVGLGKTRTTILSNSPQ